MVNKEHTHRILVAVDSGDIGLGTLRVAVKLAARYDSELLTLFIEDMNLFHLAELPFAQEVDRSSAALRQITSDQIARTMRAQADMVHRALMELTGELRVRSVMRIVRGYYLSEALSAAGRFDVLFLRGAAPSSKAQTANQPLWVIYDGSKAASRALKLAIEINSENQELIVLLTPSDKTPHLREEAIAELSGCHLPVRYFALPETQRGELPNIVRQHGCQLIVMNKQQLNDLNTMVQTLLEKVDCPIVLVP